MSKHQKLRRRSLLIREKPGIGAKNGNETPPTPEKNRGKPGKKACKSRRSEDNDENGKKQFIYAMKINSNGKSRFMTLSRYLQGAQCYRLMSNSVFVNKFY